MANDVLEPVEAEQKIVSDLRVTLRKLASQWNLSDAAQPANMARLIGLAFSQEFPVGRTDNRLANALARGIPARQKLMEAEGGSLSAEDAARALGISKPAILKRYQKRQLVAWRAERQSAVRFPVWQFKDGGVLDGIEPALKILNAGSRLDDFGRMLFFLSISRFLGGKRPLDCLRKAEITKVLQAAEGYGG